MLASVVCYFSANGYLGAVAKEPANKSLAFSAWPKEARCAKGAPLRLVAFARRLTKQMASLGHALRGLQGEARSVLAAFDRQPACLQATALIGLRSASLRR